MGKGEKGSAGLQHCYLLSLSFGGTLLLVSERPDTRESIGGGQLCAGGGSGCRLDKEEDRGL